MPSSKRRNVPSLNLHRRNDVVVNFSDSANYYYCLSSFGLITEK